MEFELILAYDRPQDVRALFTEYTDALIETDPGVLSYLRQQHYERELEDAAPKYALPDGRLYLAVTKDGDAAGCVAMRLLDGETCEMKRLFIRPQYRGHRLGERLVNRLLADGREMGCRRMRLDTFPFLTTAIALYREMGFYEIAQYNDCPLPDVLYMEKKL